MITEARFAIGEALSERDVSFPRPESRASTTVALVSSGFVHSARSATPHSQRPSGTSNSFGNRRCGAPDRPRSAIVPRTKFPPDPDDVIVKDWRYFRRKGAIWNDPLHTPEHVRRHIWRPDLDAEATLRAEVKKTQERQEETERSARAVQQRRLVANMQLQRRKGSRCQLQLQSGQPPLTTEMHTREDGQTMAHFNESTRPRSAILARHNIKGWRYFGGSLGKNIWEIPERQSPHRLRGTVDLERNNYAIRSIEEQAKEEFSTGIDEQRSRRERHDRILLRFRNQQLQNYEKERSVPRDFQRQLVAETNITNSEYNPRPTDEETLRREKSYDNIARGIARVNRRDDDSVCEPKSQPSKGKKSGRKRAKSKRTRTRCSQRIKQLATPRIRTNHPERLHLDHSDFTGLLVAVESNPADDLSRGPSETRSRRRSSLSAYATAGGCTQSTASSRPASAFNSRSRPTNAVPRPSEGFHGHSQMRSNRPVSSVTPSSSRRSVSSAGLSSNRRPVPAAPGALSNRRPVSAVPGPLSSRRPSNERWLSRKRAHIRGGGSGGRSKGGAKTARTRAAADRAKEECMREIGDLEARLRERQAARTFSEEAREFLLRKSVRLLTHRSSQASSDGSENDSEKENLTVKGDNGL